MNDTITTAPPITITPEVGHLLEERNATSQLSGLLDLVRTCFPQVQSVDVYLQEDYADPTAIRVVIETLLASTAGDDEQELQQWRVFDQQLIKLVSPENLLLFLVLPRYIVR
jgi:hypothetical protein